MTLSTFLADLVDAGMVRVDRDAPDVDAAADADRAAIEALDALARAEAPGTPPALDLTVARWAAVVLHAGCAGAVHRDLDAATLHARLAEPCPAVPSPSTAYSADLLLRYLPDLCVLARGIAATDPLHDELRALAARWPLSSVGVGVDLGHLDVGILLDDPCLRRMYVDRILARQDRSRLGDGRVLAAVQEAVGAYPELAGELAPACALQPNAHA